MDGGIEHGRSRLVSDDQARIVGAMFSALHPVHRNTFGRHRLSLGCSLTFCGSLAASEAEVDALLAELALTIPPDELAEPGSLIWPQTVAEAAEQAESLGLGADGARALKTRRRRGLAGRG